MADNPVSRAGYRYGSSNPYEELSEKIDNLTRSFSGQTEEFGGPVPRSFKDITRGEILDVFRQKQATRKELPSIFESFLNQVNRGSMDPAEARYAYLNLARASGAKPGEAYKQADILGSTPMGFTPAENYERYKPAARLAAKTLLGRDYSDAEFQNLVSAAQGLGISKGADFQDFLGRTILASPEYKSQAVIFDPEKVVSAVKTLKSANPVMSVGDYAQMLGGLT